MFFTRLKEIFDKLYVPHVIFYDCYDFSKYCDYLVILESLGYNIVEYKNVEMFRIEYENIIKNSENKYAIIINNNIYVPYDIIKNCEIITLSLKLIFPYLNNAYLEKYKHDLDLISFAYKECYSDLSDEKETEKFITNIVFSDEMIYQYIIEILIKKLYEICQNAPSYFEWLKAGQIKAKIDYYGSKINTIIDTDFLLDPFYNYIMTGYGKLSLESNNAFPVILSKVLPFIAKNKFALIVMDGMSLFDFEILSRYFVEIQYEYFNSFALIPTMTSISRQCLLSGKYPIKLSEPFNLSKEEKEFIQAMSELGYKQNTIQYSRGYNPEVSPLTKALCIIINDIDDIVHGQQQGRQGMLREIDLLGKKGKLQSLIKELFENGFSVYITSDHGNTPCTGIGAMRGLGIEVETKSKRMLVLKDFAKLNKTVQENTIEYPGYYLDKKYKYLICKDGISFDNIDDEVMTHGGISIDEVIVPFIKIRSV
ncbi:PglZ domain-containing protein [Treponema primitia]|uniref:PglZ domain-containing protein n=1 Tax=Treponema primitia TaxID=88058 RepID=UPI0002554C06|nr:PglZ domain-containing protein [Treponema primitia]